MGEQFQPYEVKKMDILKSSNSDQLNVCKTGISRLTFREGTFYWRRILGKLMKFDILGPLNVTLK